MGLLSELTPHWMCFPPNPERLEVSWGPGTVRTVLSLSPRGQGTDWPGGWDQESCSRRFPASWPPHTCLLKAGFLAPKSELPETWGEASHADDHGAKPGTERVLVTFLGAPEVKVRSVSVSGQTWKYCRRCSPPRGEFPRSLGLCPLRQVCRAEAKQLGWHPASCPSASPPPPTALWGLPGSPVPPPHCQGSHL